MGELELSQAAQHWVYVVLVWIGFGALAGLLAKALVPGREPAGAAGTLIIGMMGSVLGPLVLATAMHLDSQRFNPIGPLGLISAVGGALALLVGYRLLVACLPVPRPPEDEEP